MKKMLVMMLAVLLVGVLSFAVTETSNESNPIPVNVDILTHYELIIPEGASFDFIFDPDDLGEDPVDYNGTYEDTVDVTVIANDFYMMVAEFFEVPAWDLPDPNSDYISLMETYNGNPGSHTDSVTMTVDLEALYSAWGGSWWQALAGEYDDVGYVIITISSLVQPV